MNLQEFIKKSLEDPEFRKIYFAPDLAEDISLDVMEARINKRMTQKELAEKVGTKQSSIARLEDGDTLPSLRFLKKIADALGTELIPPTFASLVKVKEKRKAKMEAYSSLNRQDSGNSSYMGQFKGNLQLYEKGKRKYKKQMIKKTNKV